MKKEYTEEEVRLIIEGAIQEEREACAKACDSISIDRGMINDEILKKGVLSGAFMCSVVIRARGQE